MAQAEQCSFAIKYLESQVEDNYSRFVVATYVLGIIALLFCCRNIYHQVNDINGEYSSPYLIIWFGLFLSSAVFRFVLPTAKAYNNIKNMDFLMMSYAVIVCIIAASITALQSLLTPNFTAFSFAILGTVTAYRACSLKYVIIMAIATTQFSVVYFHFYDQPFSVLFLFPIIAICVVSFLIANSLESNRRLMLKLSMDLKKTNEKLKEESIQDPLTKLYNRRYLTDFLQREIKEFARSNESFCIAVCDLDHFKKINDTLGHLTGDQALIAIAEVLKQSSRATDILIRFGGEEFVIVMPRTKISAALTVIERMKENIEKNQFEGISWPLTASFGLTQIKPKDTDILLLARADNLLYQAKDAGRNCIMTDQVEHTQNITG
ncbi:GGDEF domain-containing protein [Psychrosphaera sp. B3R10]|uniref:GGDEF domain-containing protein n=1 Tax=unclassified Psychrosphaera TaxID=2641570 RepID=UPI001C094F7E|nr:MULTISPECIES: GGDEF domain-containing protein [unclassified Psychrosphaera]MBU2880633.1 GGDEF domain-containing protein [Psychrosphaera sp. I2R16]MBU2990719.1 GGDEF domain-containing protein [Psychrosphaera sp. B3R10]